MPTIRWRPEINALTVPESYKIRYLPRDSARTDELAAEMAAENPNYSEDAAKTMIASLIRVIKKNLISGRGVTIDNAFSFGLSFTGRLTRPDSPLPPVDEMLHVKAYALSPFVKEVQHKAQLERQPMTERLPVINAAKDTRLRLNDVLYASGVLQLTGRDLFFDPAAGSGECLIEGTRSGRAVQTQFGPISDSSIILVPNIPAQDAPFNNEYLLSVSARYTEHGPPRTGLYRRRLRSPLLLTNFGHPNPPEVGILTGNAASPFVSITGGTVAADEMLRIQAVFDSRETCLLFSLLDMQEGGQVGVAMTVTADGEYTLQGFAGSAVSSLAVRVNDYSALMTLVRNYYHGRLVDVLDVRTA